MNKKVIRILQKIEIKIINNEKLSKKELNLIRALIQCSILDLTGENNDNTSIRTTKENK